ncbi:MAG: hypothetical protein FJY98_04635 [Candidatus Liptonbacteria bacterium]|nr:hypothetical protein [Candidatus Liptonbacteria bacterium]
MVVQDWTNLVVASLQNLWVGVAAFLPTLFGALVILIVGLIVAFGVGTAVEKIFEALKLDSFLSKLGLAPFFERARMRLRASYFLGRLVYWFLIIGFLLAASDVLGLQALSEFLKDVLGYLPNVIVAVLIMLAAVVVANAVRHLVAASVMSARLHASRFLGTVAWWSVIVFGLLTALVQLNVAVSIVNSIVTGFIAMLALAGGLAFGLGGRDYAAYLINKLRDHTETR